MFQDVPAPFHIREQIASLVRFHGLPIWLLEKESLEKKILEVAMRVNTQHLAILSEVDACGRMCTDIKPLVDNIQLFREFCKEHECWRKAREFASVSAHFHYFNTENSYVDYVPFENFKCEVIMMSGLPGMGKDH